MNNEECQAYSRGLVVLPDQVVTGRKDCIDGNWREVDFAGKIHGLAAVVAVDILAGQGSAVGTVAVAHLPEQVSIHVELVARIVVEEAGTGESGAVGQSDAEAIVAAGTTVVGCVLNHGPAKQSGQHEQHERQDRHACSCQQERLQVAEQLRIGFEEEHWKAYPVFPRWTSMAVFP